jgi:hypothetical protein
MPCHKKCQADIERQKAAVTRQLLEGNAVVLPESPEEDAFLRSCEVHCVLDCCGFNAIEISDEQFRRAVMDIGHAAAKRGLNAMKEQLSRIGDHTGYVRFRGHYEPADEIKENYQKVCAILERVTNAEQAGK